jgi:digeranylgeranylglycerophospholipid reductase
MLNSGLDVLVVGGGPGGLHAAAALARRGVRTLLCEEHTTIGDPVHCTGILASDSFDEFDLPRDAVLNTLSSARFVSPSGITVTHTTPTPLATVIDRGRFDRSLACRAERAGAELRMGVRVSHIEANESGARALVGKEWVEPRLVVIACGAAYSLQRRFGLGLPKAYLHTAQRELPARHSGDVELHFGRSVAPDGFAWAVPVIRPDGLHVRIGVMASQDAPGCWARMLARVADRWGIARDETAPRHKILPLGAIERTYGDRMLVVGDAAGLVKPTTGGGIHYSVMSAELAAEAAVDALNTDRLEAASLAVYEKRWRRRLAREFEAQHALRAVVTQLDDDAIDSFFELAQTDGIMPIVRSTARFNQHRPLIRALFKHPPARRILFQSIFG